MNWEYDFSVYKKRTFENISNQDIIECIESETTILWEALNRPRSDNAFECINYVHGKFIFVIFNIQTDNIIIESARLATKGEIDKYFKF